MIVGRIVGWLLTAFAFMAGGHELLSSIEAGAHQPLPVGKLWFIIDPPSLNLAQAVVERYLLPALWDPIILFLLQRPAWLVFGLPGVALLLIFRSRRRR